MKSNAQVKMMLVKLDPPKKERRKTKRNNVEYEIENDGKDDVNEIRPPLRKKEDRIKGITSNMKSKTMVMMMLMKLDPSKQKKTEYKE